MSESSDDPSRQLLTRAQAGDLAALGELLQSHRAKLLRIIGFRMDPRLRGRLDADDVVQDAFIEATRRFPEYCDIGKSADQPREMPFFLWLRFLTVQRLFQLHRRHLGVQARDAGREISIYGSPPAEATSAVLAAHLLGKQTSPSMAAMRAEATRRVEQALNAMNEIDREVLALRRFERLQNHEVAELLNISPTAASNRYVRALERLRAEFDAQRMGESKL